MNGYQIAEVYVVIEVFWTYDPATGILTHLVNFSHVGKGQHNGIDSTIGCRKSALKTSNVISL
jgi:hypothetical protein